jgi:hypothetical protein
VQQQPFAAQQPQGAPRGPPPAKVSLARRIVGAIAAVIILPVCYVAVFGVPAFLRAENKVYVECMGTVAGYNCTADHREGSDRVNVCWEVNVACQNGTKASGTGCQDVSPGAKASTLIPFAQVKNFDKCDLATSTAVENQKITAPR